MKRIKYYYQFFYMNKYNVKDSKIIDINQLNDELAIATFEKEYPDLIWRNFQFIDRFIVDNEDKTSWNREEIISIIHSFSKDFVANVDTAYQQKNINDWISANIK